MTGSDLVAHNIGLARRVRPSPGPCAPYIAGDHPVDDSSASGTTSWPSWPTRSPCRPASGPRPAGRVGHEWPPEGSGSAAIWSSAVPAPQVGWWATLCSGRRSSRPRRTRSRRNRATSGSKPSRPMRTKCHSREARRGYHAPHRPETALVMCVPAALPAGYPPTAPHLPQHGLIWRGRGARARAAPTPGQAKGLSPKRRARAAPRGARAWSSHSPGHHVGRGWQYWPTCVEARPGAAW